MSDVEQRGAVSPLGHGRRILLSTVASDSHTWNLVFLQLLLEEHGHVVHNLGACVPVPLLLGACRERRPDAVVISTVNGHGYADGKHLIREFRAARDLAGTPVVIGGKLGVAGAGDAGRANELVELGFDAVFADGSDPAALDGFLRRIDAGPPVLEHRRAG